VVVDTKSLGCKTAVKDTDQGEWPLIQQGEEYRARAPGRLGTRDVRWGGKKVTRNVFETCRISMKMASSVTETTEIREENIKLLGVLLE